MCNCMREKLAKSYLMNVACCTHVHVYHGQRDGSQIFFGHATRTCSCFQNTIQKGPVNKFMITVQLERGLYSSKLIMLLTLTS